jgi:hypothetical protein
MAAGKKPATGGIVLAMRARIRQAAFIRARLLPGNDFLNRSTGAKPSAEL